MHLMRLYNRPFQDIKNGNKTIEIRLYDEKRRLINENDIIEFTNLETNEKMKVKVIKLYVFNSFEELFSKFDKALFGYLENEVADPKDMEKYYNKEEELKYGAVGIEIRKVDEIDERN